MRLTALLMASAAALVPSSLSAGELVLGVDPIDYVRVCDAFGSGYMYLPGSQTCLSVGAYLQFDAWFYDSRESQHFFNVADYLTGAVAPGTDPSNPLAERSGVVAGYLYDTDDYAAAWTMSEEIKVTTIAQTQTDIGVVATYARLVVYNGIDPTNSNDAAALAKTVTLDRAYAAIGPVFVGYYDSIFAYQAAALSLDANINATRRSTSSSSTTPSGRGASPSRSRTRATGSPARATSPATIRASPPPSPAHGRAPISRLPSAPPTAPPAPAGARSSPARSARERSRRCRSTSPIRRTRRSMSGAPTAPALAQTKAPGGRPCSPAR